MHARMAFIYTFTIYLSQVVGVNERNISHSSLFWKSPEFQIKEISTEFLLILQTLEHHNDDKLWIYVYSFIFNAAAYIKELVRRLMSPNTSLRNSISDGLKFLDETNVMGHSHKIL